MQRCASAKCRILPLLTSSETQRLQLYFFLSPPLVRALMPWPFCVSQHALNPVHEIGFRYVKGNSSPRFALRNVKSHCVRMLCEYATMSWQLRSKPVLTFQRREPQRRRWCNAGGNMQAALGGNNTCVKFCPFEPLQAVS